MARLVQGILQPLPVPTAMLGLAGGPLAGIKGESHHQQLDPALGHEGQQDLQIPGQGSPGQGGQGRDRDAEGIATGQANAPVSNIEGQGGSGPRGGHSALAHRRWHRPTTRLELLQHSSQASGRPEGALALLAPPDTAGHQHHVAVFFGLELGEPGLARGITHLAMEPDLVAGGGQAAQQEFGGGSEQVGPAGVHAQLNLVPTSGMVLHPAGRSHGFVAIRIDQQPAMAPTAIQQIFNAAVQHLAQGGWAGRLFEVPEQGSVAPLQGSQQQVGS